LLFYFITLYSLQSVWFPWTSITITATYNQLEYGAYGIQIEWTI